MDPIADMISQIRNAGQAGKALVKVPYSKHKMEVAEALVSNGYLVSVDHKGQQPKKVIELELAYDDTNVPRIKGTRRVSKTSRRVYEKAKNLTSYRRGYGHRIISTPNGIMTDVEARDSHVGGEILFEIW